MSIRKSLLSYASPFSKAFSSSPSSNLTSSSPSLNLTSPSLNLTSSSSPNCRRILTQLKQCEDCDAHLTAIEEKDGLSFSNKQLNLWASHFLKKNNSEKAIQIYNFLERKSLSLTSNCGPCSGLSPYLERTTFAKAIATIAPSILVVTLSDCTTQYNGVVADLDVLSDVAVVKIQPRRPLSSAKIGVSKEARTGDLVLTGGSTLAWPNSFSCGMISHINRTKKELYIHGKIKNYLQTDCKAAEGNSGGPLVNIDGKVIGMVIGGHPGGIEFASPIDAVLEIVKGMY